MSMTLIADSPVDVDAEGFLTDPAQWNEQIGEAIAAQNGIPELTMTELLEHTNPTVDEPATIEKVSIVVSKGSLEGIYPALIMANGARMEGIEADLFFTFFGLDAIRKDRYEKIKVATVGNPGMHMATWIGAIPGFSALATGMMKRQMEKIDIPPIPEFIELVHDSGVHLYACKATVDMFGLTMDAFVPQVEDIISVGEFYETAAGGQIIFT